MARSNLVPNSFESKKVNFTDAFVLIDMESNQILRLCNFRGKGNLVICLIVICQFSVNIF